MTALATYAPRVGGLTLVELMITLAVGVTLMAVTVPSYVSMTGNNQLASGINGLVAEMQYARSEALKRSQTVAVCPSADGASCNTGWSPSASPERLVFVDADDDGQFTTGDTLLKRVSSGSGPVGLAPSSDTQSLSFTREGLLSATAASITFTAGGSDRCLVFSLTGRSKIEPGACP